MYAGKWTDLVQERGARGSGNGETEVVVGARALAQVVVGAGAPAQVVVGAGALVQAGVQGRASSVQVRGAANVGLCMAPKGASAGGRAVSAQEGKMHGSAVKRGRLGSSDE